MFHVEQRIHTVAYGRVQGVGFRAFVHRTATRLNLAGYTRNLPDGSVLTEAAGPAAAIRQLRDALSEGPPHARVERIEDRPLTGEPLPRPFTIRY